MRRLQKEIADSQLESQSIAKQTVALKKELKGLSEADQNTLSLKDKYDAEEEIINAWSEELSTTVDLVERLQSGTGNVPTKHELPDTHPNADLLASIHSTLDEALSRFRKGLAAALERLSSV